MFPVAVLTPRTAFKSHSHLLKVSLPSHVRTALTPLPALGLSRDRSIYQTQHLRKRHAGFPLIDRLVPQGARDDG
jgi:hypothetical protein